MELESASRIRLFLAYGMDLLGRYLGAAGAGKLSFAVLLSLAFLCLLILFWTERAFREVAIWNIGWDGKERSLGRLFIRRSSHMSTLNIPKEYLERSDTTAFRIRPGMLLENALCNEELVIISGEKRIRLEFSGPMRFKL